jgi:hypothetical protein
LFQRNDSFVAEFQAHHLFVLTAIPEKENHLVLQLQSDLILFSTLSTTASQITHHHHNRRLMWHELLIYAFNSKSPLSAQKRVAIYI